MGIVVLEWGKCCTGHGGKLSVREKGRLRTGRGKASIFDRIAPHGKSWTTLKKSNKPKEKVTRKNKAAELVIYKGSI